MIAADPEQSQIAGNVGSAMTPGSTEIWNHVTGEWDSFDETVRSPFMAFGGWQAAVPMAADNQEAAWHFVEFLSNPDNSMEAAITGGSGVNPYRYSHFERVDQWLDIFSEQEAQLYLDRPVGKPQRPERRARHAAAGLLLLYGDPGDRAVAGAGRRR